jgi:hypothetical protein
MKMAHVAATQPFTWSIQKECYVPMVGEGSLEMDIDLVAPKVFDQGILVIVEVENGTNDERDELPKRKNRNVHERVGNDSDVG